jgi:hypothetical protein
VLTEDGCSDGLRNVFTVDNLEILLIFQMLLRVRLYVCVVCTPVEYAMSQFVVMAHLHCGVKFAFDVID